MSKDSSYPFYWIGDAGSSKLSKDAVEFFKKNDAQGLSTIIERDGDRVHAVHVGEFCYGMLIPDVEM